MRLSRGLPCGSSAYQRASTVTTLKLPAPKLGEERWGQLLTFAVGGRSSVVKQTAVRTGTVVVVVSGSGALVDAQVAKAVDKAHGAG
ncbi:hypothetical protein C6376_10565 [Streptomyces sp. P3]|nr:hypothetical protein C6376_10565 [Streptomyces sp. P3]